MNWLRKNWLVVLVFAVVATVLMIDLNPDYTFMNKAQDSIGYIYSAKYLYPSYLTSPPLYLLTGHVFLQIPIGTDAWRMGLISVLSTLGACVFIYLCIKEKLGGLKYVKWLALFGVLIYGLSALVLSQSIIVNTYPLVCMCAVGAYYFAIKQQWKRMALMLGAGLAVHVLMGFVFIIMFAAFKGYRKNWRAILITLAFGLFYLYIPLTNRPPYMWLPKSTDMNPIWAFITGTMNIVETLIGQLSIWDLPKRLLDVASILGVSIGVLAIVPLVFYFKKKHIFNEVLFWLIVIPIVIFISELDRATFDYMMLAMPFIAIVIPMGIMAMLFKYGRKAQYFAFATLALVGLFGAYAFNYYDIGRTEDKNMSAANLVEKEFAKIPDGAIFMPNYSWEWEAMFKYNADNKKHIYPISIYNLPNEPYQKQLAADGIKFVVSHDKDVGVASQETAQSIVTMNDNVWTTVQTDPSTFGTKVVATNHDINDILAIDQARAAEVSAHPQIAWKPYNPYQFMATSIMVSQWDYVLSSNYNVSFFFMLAAIGLFLNWLIFTRREYKEKADEHEEVS